MSLATRARAAVRRKGAAVTFRLDSAGTYDETTDRRTGPTSVVVTGTALGGASDPLVYQALALLPSDAVTLYFTPDTPGEVPPLGAVVTWGGVVWTVRSAEPAAMNGVAIGATVIAQSAGAVSIVVPSTTPELYWRLTAGDALPTGSTVVRALAAFQTTAAGALSSVAPNVLRDDHWIGGIRTQLVEGLRRNLLTQSANMVHADWTKQANVTATANAVTAPDGTMTGTQIDWGTAATGNGVFQVASAVSTTIANTKALWVRAAAPGGTVGLSDPFQSIGTTVLTLTAAWQRAVLSEVQSGGVAGLYLLKRADSPATVFVWNGEVDDAPYAESDIVTTTAAVTRPADVVTIPGFAISGAATLYQKYFDLATAAWVEVVTPYTSGAAIPRVADRAYALDKIALGTRTLAEMQAL